MKPVKIKRNRNIYSKKREITKRILKVVITLLVCGGLVGIGFLVAEPVTDFLSGKYNVQPSSSSSSSSSTTSQESSSGSTPQKEEAKKTVAVRMTAEMGKDPAAMKAFLEDAKAKGYTSVGVEVKASDGVLQLDVGNEAWKTAGIISNEAPLASSVVAAIKEAGLTPVAYVSTFADQAAAYWDRNMAIGYGGPNVLWLDNAANAGGKPWLNPYSSATQQFIQEQIKLVYASGFAEIVLTGMQFPQYGDVGSMAYYGDVGGTTREALFKSFASACLALAGEDLKMDLQVTYGVAVSEVTAMYPITYFDTEITRVCVVMQADQLNIDGTSEEQAITQLKAGIEALKAKSGSATIIPVLPSDTPFIEGQIRTLQELGFTEYLVK